MAGATGDSATGSVADVAGTISGAAQAADRNRPVSRLKIVNGFMRGFL
jgi:hypothetical protein